MLSRTNIPQFQADQLEWFSLYGQLKNNCYKFMYSDIDAYVIKVQNLMSSDLHHPKILLKKHDHKVLLHELKINFLKVVDDLNIIDLHNIAMCIQYVFDKLLTCFQVYFQSLLSFSQSLTQQTTLNHSRFVHQSKCSECQLNVHKVRIESLSHNMTVANHQPNIQEIQRINKQLVDLSTSYEDIELSLMIEQLLQRKETILNCKNPRIGNIYDQIAQYLESIPQSTINFSKDYSFGANGKPSLSQFQIGNFSQELQNNFAEMLRNPIKKLIKRILEYAKSLYCKQKQSETIGTQTLLIKDEENIKMLLKNNETLKKQLQVLKNLKRQAEKDMVKLLDSQQKNQIKISQLITQNTFLQQKYERLNMQLTTTKARLQQIQINKKQMSEKLVKDYTGEKAVYLKTIRQLQIKIQITDHQLMRLRKQTQGAMISELVQTNSCQTASIQTQTQQRFNSMAFTQLQTRNSLAPNASRKNVINKFNNGSFVRKSDNHDNHDNQFGNQSDQINQNQSKFQNQRIQNHSQFLKANKAKKLTTKIQQHQEFSQNASNKEEKNHSNQGSQIISKRIKKRESIVEKINTAEEKVENFHNQNFLDPLYDKKSFFGQTGNQLFMRGQKKKLTQTIKIIMKQDQISQTHRSQVNLRLQSKFSNKNGLRQKQKDLNSRQSDHKRLSPSGNLIRSRAKLQSSRMFISKQHCSPYIGSGSVPNLDQHWLELIQVNNFKRDNEMINQAKKQNENSEKIKFISKLMEKYSKLKQCGLLNKINQIVASKQFSDQQEQGKMNQRDGRQRQQKLGVISAKATQIIKHKKIKNNSPDKLSKQNRGVNLFSKIKSKIQYFSKSQAILLFGSIELAKKYQFKKQIWQTLENSIMLDYNFMNLCDSIEIFFNYLQKNQPFLYFQCQKFLTQPILYLQNEGKNKGNKQQNIAPTHSRKVSSMMYEKIQKIMKKSQQQHKENANANENENQVKGVRSPHELRNIMHKILRFHKIIHKKCTHTEQFLSLIGLKLSYA